MVGASERRSWRVGVSRSQLAYGAVLVAITAVAVESGYEAAVGGDKLLMVVPAAALAGIFLCALGLVNFEAFAFTTIVIRSSLDITRPQLGNNGAAGIGTASASGLDPAGALAVIFMLAGLFWWLARHRAGVKSPPPSVHRIALIFFATVGYVSVIDSAQPFVSVLEAIRVSAVAAMLAVMEVLLVDRAAVRRLITSIYLSSLVPILVTFFFLAQHHPQFASGGFGRYQGTFSQPNPFAIYLTMLIVMGAALIPHISSRRRLMLIPLLLACTVCLYYTYTRSAWVATIIGLFAVAIIGRRKILLGVLIAGVVFSLVAVPSVAQRFADLGSNQVNTNGNTSNSLTWRFDYWGTVLPLADKNPITGIGLKMSSFETTQAKEPHNDFLRSYVEEGAVGVVAYLTLLLSMFLVARQSLRESAPGFDRSIAVGFAGCVIAFLIISVVSNVITEVIVLWYYVAFAAAAYAVTQYRKPEYANLRQMPTRLAPREAS
ncbi:MAG: O-antigen ligase family protein [Candidatus Dormibacterales bacterium]